MRTTHTSSHIEIWDTTYINNPRSRRQEDREKKVIQAEPLPGRSDFLVEIVEAVDR